MAFSGAGVFSRIHSWIADRDNGIKITAVRHDAEDDGFATGLSNTICRDGQSTITAAIPFSAQKITDLGNATADADALNRITADNRLTNKAECRLAYVTSSQIKLSPFGGNLLMIAGLRQVIPAAGVTLSNSGLTNNLIYYIYAYMNAATMTLEASITAFAVDTTTGMPIKSGDSTRTLVGKVLVAGGAADFFDEAEARFVLSYWNRVARTVTYAAVVPTNSTSSSTNWNTVTVLSWADEGLVTFSATGYLYSAAAQTGSIQHLYNGNTAGISGAYTVNTAGGAFGLASVAPLEGPAEGVAYSVGTHAWKLNAWGSTATAINYALTLVCVVRG